MTNFKSRIPRDAKYLAYVRTTPCCMCGYQHHIQAHHVHTGGMGLKGSDYETVGLCMVCHSDVHNSGRKDAIPNVNEVITRLKANYKGEME